MIDFTKNMNIDAVTSLKGVRDGQHIMIWKYNDLLWSAAIRKTDDKILFYIEGEDRWEGFDESRLHEDAEIVAYIIGG